jgi:hypothetical protein
MDESIGIAEVIDVMKQPVVELAEGVEAGGSGQAAHDGYQILYRAFSR